jgi:hypothetical protein
MTPTKAGEFECPGKEIYMKIICVPTFKMLYFPHQKINDKEEKGLFDLIMMGFNSYLIGLKVL